MRQEDLLELMMVTLVDFLLKSDLILYWMGFLGSCNKKDWEDKEMGRMKFLLKSKDR